MSIQQQQQQKRLGVIGGLGPLATAYFYELITLFTEVTREQEHLEILLFSRPAIPDRTAAILDPACPSPLPGIIETGKALAAMGAEVIAMPCVTAHYFYEQYAPEIPAEMLHMPRETASFLREAGVCRAGILATDGTVRSGVLARALAEQGISSVLPSPEGQAAVMSLIYDYVKAGRTPEKALFDRVAGELRAAGAEVLLLGCTELSLLRRQNLEGDSLDLLEVLALRSIQRCGGRVREDVKLLG